MKNILYLFLIAIVGLSSCKSDEEKAAEQALVDDQLILDYAAENNLTLEAHESGIYYMVNEVGTGSEHPIYTSDVTVHYQGTLLSGSIFDSSYGGNAVTFNLQGVIPGWQIAIPLMVKGEKTKFIIPSALAYGPSGNGFIGENEILIFDIELQKF